MPFVTIKGIKTNYEIGEGNDPTVVFVHGAGGSSVVWYNQLQVLRGNFRAIAIDLPGHGRSAFATTTENAEFVAQFTAALGIDRFILSGHSMGGATSIEFALRFPERLSGLILVGTGARLRISSEILEGLGKGEFPFADSRQLFGPDASESMVDHSWREMQEVGPDVYLADFQACHQFDRSQDIAQIKTPTQIIVGDLDVMTPVKYSVFLNEAISGSHIKVITGAGHMVMLEKPVELNQALLDFLKRL